MAPDNKKKTDESKKRPHTKITPDGFRVESPGTGISLHDIKVDLDLPKSDPKTEEPRRRPVRLSDAPKTISEGSFNRAQLLSLADDSQVEGTALDLIDQATLEGPPSAQQKVASDPLVEMRDRFSLGDYSGALVVAESLLEEDPEHAEALKCAENCRSVLSQMYTARIGPLVRVPFIAVPREQLKWLSIDHRAGFVLSHVDGVSNLEQILDVSGMPALDALRILYELAQQRVINFR